jgi:hypothetical protein
VGKTDPVARRITLGDESVWPAIIIIALAVVMAVNAAFIYIAVSGADEVAPSYMEGER